MRGAATVFRKELLDGIRDRRAFIAVLVSISIFPIMMLLIGRFGEGIRDEVRNMEVPVEGRENAPALVEWLERQPGLELTPAPEDPESAVQEHEVDLVLRIPADYEERFRRGTPRGSGTGRRQFAGGGRGEGAPRHAASRGLWERGRRPAPH